MGQVSPPLVPRTTNAARKGLPVRYTGTHVGNVRTLPVRAIGQHGETHVVIEEEDNSVDLTGMILAAEVISETVVDASPTYFADTTPDMSFDSGDN